MDLNLLKLYKQLYSHFGPQNWWPILNRTETVTETGLRNPRFEICVGAILTQNTSWTNVEKALRNLNNHGLLNPEAIIRSRASLISRLIRPAGYFNQKTKKLKLFSEFVMSKGGFDELFDLPIPILREELLSVWGIGRETADSIILYAAEKPIFVIDAYTKRLLDLYGVRFDDYDDYRLFFENQLPRKTKLWNEYHALIVRWSKLLAKDRKSALRIVGIKKVPQPVGCGTR